jgi:hypothetical protein
VFVLIKKQPAADANIQTKKSVDGESTLKTTKMEEESKIHEYN